MKPSLVIVGLGNPGAQYARTRHNVGFMAVDHLHEDYGTTPWTPSQKFQSEIAEATIDGTTVLLMKPQTFMNRSGEAIRKIVDFYKLNTAINILVIVDDIDIPLGTERLRLSGGPGTHNGLKSIVECLGEDFPRLRIGIGPKPENIDLAAWVLSAMSEEERSALRINSETILDTIRQCMDQE